MDIDKIKETLVVFDITEVMDILESGELKAEEFVYPGYTDVLLSLITHGYPNYVQAVVENGFNFQKNKFNYLLASLLSVSSENRDFSVFKLLFPLVGKEMYTKKDEMGMSPWTYAFHAGYLKPITMMLDAGIDINHRDHKGATGLYYYLRNNNISDNFLKLILKNKDLIDWNKKDNMGISLMDIILSARHSYIWIAVKNHKLLLNGLDIQYEG